MGMFFPLPGLNRTSVGLKGFLLALWTLPGWLPQSNQRGIESYNSTHGGVGLTTASIEPAWD